MKTKRLLSILLAFAMAIALLPTFTANVFAVGITSAPAWRINDDLSITEYTTLSSAFDNSNPDRILSGETLYLNDGIIDGTDNYDITIDCDVIIQGTDDDGDGQYSIIDAQNLGQVFVIDSDITVTLNNITFTNGETSGDGAAIINNGAMLSITDCFFIDNNSSAGRGGAIFQDETGSLTLDNVIFEGNSSFNGGAIYIDDTGVLTICGNSGFYNNTAFSGGGAIYNKGTTEIGAGTLFNNNKVTVYGGAIYSDGILIVTESMFINNTSTGGNGGAIFNVISAIVADSTFSGNSAPDLGGAILNGGDIYVNGSTFTDNTAGTGGAIATDSDITNTTVNNSTFINNNATVNGGAIYILDGTVVIANSTIYGNESGIYALEGVTSVLNSIVVRNNGIPGISIFSDIGSEVNLYHTLYGLSDGSTVNVLDGSESRLVLDIFGTSTPTLADNGGPTETIAVAVDSQTAGQGVRTAMADNGVYGYWNGADWIWLNGNNYSTFTEINTDQRGVGRGTSRVSTGAYQSSAAYAVTWEANGGLPLPTQSLVYHDNDSIVAPDPMTNADYTFVGWYTNASLTTPAIFPIENVSAATTLYAKWTKTTSAPTYYTVTFDTDGGSNVNNQTVVRNSKATMPTDPTKDGYDFAGWYEGEAFATEYDFSKGITANITIYAKWVETPTTDVWENPFVDITEDDWFYNDVEYVYTNGLMFGVGDMKFDPNANLSRAMLVTVLYRLESSPAVSGTSPFNDVPTGQWYTDAIIWAAANGIVNGYGNGDFGPNDNITREQLATILYRYQQFSGKIPADIVMDKKYSDWDDISGYAKNAVNVLTIQGIILGKPSGMFDPQGSATRAEGAAMLHRFLETATSL